MRLVIYTSWDPWGSICNALPLWYLLWWIKDVIDRILQLRVQSNNIAVIAHVIFFVDFFPPIFLSVWNTNLPVTAISLDRSQTFGFTSCFSVRVACTATWIRQHIFISKWQIGQIPMIPKTTYVTVPKMTYDYLHCHVVNVVKTFAAWLGLGSDLVRKKHHGLKEVR